MHRFLPRLLAAGCLAALATSAQAGVVDYAQADTSSNATTFVLVKAIGTSTDASPAGIASINYTRWETGEAAGIGYVYRWAVAGETHRWIVGAGVGVNSFNDRGSPNERSDASLSARGQSEWFGPAPGGTYYALAQAASFRSSWLAVAQYKPTALPVGVEWSRYHERGYQATSLGLSIGIGVPRWSLRIGANHANRESTPYIGIAYNGF